MKRIIRLDASAIKESACFRKLYLITVEGYRERKLNNDIHYGTAVHKCVEEAPRSKEMFLPVKAAQDKWREEEAGLYVKDKKKYLNLTHLTMTCQMFLEQRSNIYEGMEILTNPVTGQPMVEEKFSIPLFEDEELLILLQGTIDSIVKIKGGCVAIADWKTTTSWNSDLYFESYDLSPQLKTYLWALQWYKKNYPPISALLEGKGQIGCFIFGAFLNATDIVKFKKSKMFWFGVEAMAEFEIQLMELVERLRHKLMLSPDVLPPAEGSFNGACSFGYGEGGKCKFHKACAAQTQMGGNASLVRHVLNSEFIKREYRPLNFGGGNNKQKENSNEKDNVSIGTTGESIP